MRNSINHQVSESESTVYVGTNQEYAIYHEYGTGIYADNGQGRKTPWRYVDAEGKGHTTRGMKPIHMLKNGIGDHISEFKRIAENELKK
jgi:phage gpG-like protein